LRQLQDTYRYEYLAVDLEIGELPVVEASKAKTTHDLA
jgi:hypothetical protein